MRNTRTDAKAGPGWQVDWRVEDRYRYLTPGAEVHLRYTDLTTEAEAGTAESWVSLGSSSFEDAWIPRLMVRRRAKEGPLSSTFVGVIEPGSRASNLVQARRLPLETPEGDKANAEKYSRAYARAGGTNQALVSKWLEFLKAPHPAQ